MRQAGNSSPAIADFEELKLLGRFDRIVAERPFSGKSLVRPLRDGVLCMRSTIKLMIRWFHVQVLVAHHSYISTFRRCANGHRGFASGSDQEASERSFS